MTADEFALIEGDLTASTNSQTGLINVNTATETVLACVPGIGTDRAPDLISRRPSDDSTLPSLAWVAEVLDETNVVEAGPYLTGRSYQYTVDIAAVGRLGRGYRWVRWVCDTSGGVPKFIRRRELTHLGWALGPDALDPALFANRTR